jgi:hypothetical protein
MEFELAPQVSVQTGTFNAMIAPEELVLPALINPENGRYLFLYLAGNISVILPALTTRPCNMDVRRAVSPGQLAMEIRSARYSIIFVEHDPLLYEGPEDAETVSHALKGASEGSVVVLYSSKSDPWFDLLLAMADRVYFFREPPVTPRDAPVKMHTSRKFLVTGKGQVTLEGFFTGVL